MRIALAGVLIVVVAVAAGCGSSGSSTMVTAAGHSEPKVVLPEETDIGQICKPAKAHPTRFGLDCQRGFQLTGLKWHHWGEPVAYADGRTILSDCEPNCEQGTMTAHPIQIIVSQIETCADNQRRYTYLTWSFPAGNGPGASSAGSHLSIPCPEP